MGAFLVPDNSVLRTDLKLETDKIYHVPFRDMRVWDAAQTLLPTTSATDDLGITPGAFGSAGETVITSDLKTAGATTRYARFHFTLPVEYVAGQAVQLAVAVKTSAVADTTSTIDFVVHKLSSAGTLSADLVTTSATSINSASTSIKTFAMTSTALSPGDRLDGRMAVAVNDAAGGSPVIVTIYSLYFLLPVRG